MLLFFVGVYFVLTHFFSEVQINRYDSFATVQAQKAIEQGWIPKNLPHSAYDIVETHSADSREIFGKFSYLESDEATFLAGLKASKDVYEGEGFLFKVNRISNLVDFRNIP